MLGGEKCFFYERFPGDHQQPACTTASPSPCGSSEPLLVVIREELRSHSLIMSHGACFLGQFFWWCTILDSFELSGSGEPKKLNPEKVDLKK